MWLRRNSYKHSKLTIFGFSRNHTAQQSSLSSASTRQPLGHSTCPTSPHQQLRASSPAAYRQYCPPCPRPRYPLRTASRGEDLSAPPVLPALHTPPHHSEAILTLNMPLPSQLPTQAVSRARQD